MKNYNFYKAYIFSTKNIITKGYLKYYSKWYAAGAERYCVILKNIKACYKKPSLGLNSSCATLSCTMILCNYVCHGFLHLSFSICNVITIVVPGMVENAKCVNDFELFGQKKNVYSNICWTSGRSPIRLQKFFCLCVWGPLSFVTYEPLDVLFSSNVP